MKIFVFTGPHGAGRRTVAEMSGSTLGMKHILTYTTRPRRSSEVNGGQYHFITEEEFARARENNEFIEVSLIDGYHYGVKRQDVDSRIAKQKSAYLILDHHGADTLKKELGDQLVRVFIYCAPDLLVERARAEGYSEADIARYMSHYDEEMAYRSECEHAFENIDLAHTVFDLTKTLDQYLNRNLLDLD